MKEDPEITINETMLLATLANNRNILLAVLDLKIDYWFFRDNSNRKLFLEMMRIINQRTFDEYKAVMIASVKEESRLFKNLMLEDAGFYKRMFEEDDYIFLNMVNFYKKDSRIMEFTIITSQISNNIELEQDYHECVSRLADLQISGAKVDKMNCHQIADAIETEPEKERFRTGIESLDSLVRLYSSSLLILGGESSSGKTSLANQIIYNFLLTTDFKCLYFSLETTQTRLGLRFERHIQLIDRVDEKASHERFRKLGEKMSVFKLVSEIADIEKLVREEKRRDDEIKFIVVDYLQIVDAGNVVDETPRVALITKTLHKLAQELGVLVILLSQLTKKDDTIKKGGEKKRLPPTMNTLRGSGQIANSADYIFINWFNDVHHSGKGARDVNIQVVKQKEGSQGKVECCFVGQHFTFMER
jgi:archaellum biogenesis ATPase FlaH